MCAQKAHIGVGGSVPRLGPTTILQGAGRGANQAPEFRVRFSEWLAVYDFVSNLSARVRQNSFKKLFADSAFSQDRYKALLADVDKLMI